MFAVCMINASEARLTRDVGIVLSPGKFFVRENLTSELLRFL